MTERLRRNINGWLRWYDRATADDDNEYLNDKGWDDAEALASTSMGLLAGLNLGRVEVDGDEALRSLVERIARLSTDAEMDGNMDCDDAVQTLGDVIEMARAALAQPEHSGYTEVGGG